MILQKIISGGQTGADQAGLITAKRFRLQTGGTMPLGFRTLDGPRPELALEYGLTEALSSDYGIRTVTNVIQSDGTVRLAANFSSAGEKLTLSAIRRNSKPWFDVDLTDPPPVIEFVDWLEKHAIKTLNVAGNSEQTFPGACLLTRKYLTEAFFALGLEMAFSKDDLIRLLELPKQCHIYTADRRLLDSINIVNGA